MPYKSNTELPKSIQKLPVGAQTMYRQTYNSSARTRSSTRSSNIAWAVVKKRFDRTPNGEWVARAGAFHTTTYYKFSMKRAEQFVTRTKEGNIIQNYVLTDLMPDDKGTAPTVSLMNKWAKWINTSQPQVDTDHQLFEQVTRAHGGNTGVIKAMMAAKTGIAKAVKAVVDKGRLIVSLLFDKRYERHMNRVKGLSIEAGVTRDLSTDKWVDGDLFGFTLATENTPLNPRAVRV